MAIQLQAESRRTGIRSTLKQLRAEGKVPAVVYGKEVPDTAIAVDEGELRDLLGKHPSAVIGLSIDGGPAMPVMIHDVQRDSLKQTILHVDFLRINMAEPVRVKVALEAAGEAPGVKEGGILQWQTREAEIRCLPDRIPEALSVDLSGLEIGDSILAGELSVPEGVELLHEPDEVIVTVLAAQKPAGDEPAGEGEAQEQEANQ